MAMTSAPGDQISPHALEVQVDTAAAGASTGVPQAVMEEAAQWNSELFAILTAVAATSCVIVIVVAATCYFRVKRGNTRTAASDLVQEDAAEPMYALAQEESKQASDQRLNKIVRLNVLCCSLGWSLTWLAIAVDVAAKPASFAGLPAASVAALLAGMVTMRVALYVAELFLIHVPTYLLVMRCRWADLKLIVGPRHRWSEATVHYFETAYGERRVKMVDAIIRRSSHCLNNLLMQTWLIPWLCPGAGVKMVAQQLVAAAVCFPLIALLRTDGWLGATFFVGSRIRDGKHGRMNKLNVKAIALITFPVSTLTLHSFAQPTPSDLKFLMMLTAQPLLWGDALAELVGSFLGRLEFKVSGVGEVNRKTIEGCAACWLSCFVAGWVVMSLHGFPLHRMHAQTPQGRATVLVVQATMATLAETFTFRSFDNVSIVFSSALTVSLFYRF